MPRRTAALALVTALALAAPARAQTSPTELARRGLIDQAEAARRAGDHARAVELAGRAAQIRSTPSLRLLLAQEHDALGHLLDALDHASGCAREAEADAALRNRARILAACRALATRLARRVGHVVVRVPRPAPDGLVVRVAGDAVGAALWGEALPVVPGAVEIDAERPPDGRFRRTVNVDAGEREEVAVELAATPPRAPPPPLERTARADTTTPAAPPPTQPTVPRDDGARARTSRGPAVGPWIVLGVGAAGLATSVTFFVLRNGAQSSRDAECDPAGRGPCGDRALAEGHDADYRAYTTVTNVSLAIGAAGVTAGALWLLLGRGSAPTRATQTARLGVVPLGNGALFELGGAL